MLLFSSKNFIVSALTQRSLFHLEVIFCIWCAVRSDFILWCGSPPVLATLIGESYSFPIKFLCHSYCVVVYLSLLRPRGLEPSRLLCPWESPGKNIGMHCRFHLQGIFPAQGLNLSLLHLLHWQADYHWASRHPVPLITPSKPCLLWFTPLCGFLHLVWLNGQPTKGRNWGQIFGFPWGQSQEYSNHLCAYINWIILEIATEQLLLSENVSPTGPKFPK